MKIKTFYGLSYEEQDHYIQQLEDSKNNNKWAFFVDLLKNPDDSNENFDLLAIDILKIFETAKIPTDYLDIVDEIIIEIINKCQDDEITNYALIASKNFINKSDRVKGVVFDFLQTNCEDLTLRFNALNSFNSLSSVEEKLDIFKQFRKDEQLKKYATFFLEELSSLQ